jgi:hypothetical protein
VLDGDEPLLRAEAACDEEGGSAGAVLNDDCVGGRAADGEDEHGLVDEGEHGLQTRAGEERGSKAVRTAELDAGRVHTQGVARARSEDRRRETHRKERIGRE